MAWALLMHLSAACDKQHSRAKPAPAVGGSPQLPAAAAKLVGAPSTAAGPVPPHSTAQKRTKALQTLTCSCSSGQEVCGCWHAGSAAAARTTTLRRATRGLATAGRTSGAAERAPSTILQSRGG